MQSIEYKNKTITFITAPPLNSFIKIVKGQKAIKHDPILARRERRKRRKR